MAKTYNELKQKAEEIRTNVLPESNTAELVGRQFLDMLDRSEEDHSSTSGSTPEYNVSANHSSQGIDSGNRYYLSTAVAMVPVKIRKPGLKITYLQKNHTWTTYQYCGQSISDFLDTDQWAQIVGNNLFAIDIVDGEIIVYLSAHSNIDEISLVDGELIIKTYI